MVINRKALPKRSLLQLRRSVGIPGPTPNPYCDTIMGSIDSCTARRLLSLPTARGVVMMKAEVMRLESVLWLHKPQHKPHRSQRDQLEYRHAPPVSELFPSQYYLLRISILIYTELFDHPSSPFSAVACSVLARCRRLLLLHLPYLPTYLSSHSL